MQDDALLALILGLALGGWCFYSGLRGIRKGEILATSRKVSRVGQPGIFWFVVLVLRFSVGIILIAGGLYQALFSS